MRLYNTMSRTVEPLRTQEPGVVRMYTCGPTVYDRAHIGNFRTFICEDLLRRYLKYRGYRVVQVMNITDVDDKTIRGAGQAGLSLRAYTDRFIQAFFEDYDALRLERVEYYPRATDHIPQMVALIQRLAEKGHAYESQGSWYFRIASFPAYGRLSRLDARSIIEGFRVETDEYTKEDVRDFVLWKAAKPGEPFWETPLGPGRPGWHIECSAMAMHYLGETLDLHGGGVDLIFPHHENEIAQSEAATGKTFVRHWFHCEHLIVEGQKMSKSLGNVLTVRQLLDEGVDPLALRYLLMSVHYRKPLNFTRASLRAAHEAVHRLHSVRRRLETEPHRADDGVDVEAHLAGLTQAFETSLDDDLGIAEALGALFQAVRQWNVWLDRDEIGRPGARRVLDWLERIDAVLGLVYVSEAQIDEEIERLIQLRHEARLRRDFATADRIRENLRQRGILLEDTRTGTRWRRLTPAEMAVSDGSSPRES